MAHITLSDEQVLSLINQLPKKKKEELVDHLLFEQWLDSPEASKLKEESEKAAKEGRTMTLDQTREKLRKNGKDI